MRAGVTAATLALLLVGGGPAEAAWAQEPAKLAAAAAQAAATSAPVVTEAKRREILRAAETLTGETFWDTIGRAEAGDAEAQVLHPHRLDAGQIACAEVVGMAFDMDIALHVEHIANAPDDSAKAALDHRGGRSAADVQRGHWLLI